MSLTDADVGHVVVALIALLCAAHVMGRVFARLRQPPVIGEIVGGLMLGPTLLGALLPDVQGALFPTDGPTPVVLGAVYQLGLLLLMFAAGAEIRSVFRRGERRTAAFVTLAGTVLPFAFGLALLTVVDLDRYRGVSGGPVAFLLVFAAAMAVTSIPVISRIMLDLGVAGTPFARIVLAAAVLEDIPLYVILAIALGLAQADQTATSGLPALLGLEPAGELAVAYHVVATLAFFAFALTCGPRLFRAVSAFRFNGLNAASPIAFQLVFMLLSTAVCVFLGVTPMFGAFLAGMAASSASEDPDGARAAITRFAFAFFIPVYFAIVGLKLDLIKHFDPLFFVGFLSLACCAKALSVYGGARLAGEARSSARNLAVAMNARGGPGIVLASVAYDAGIIRESFYTSLVMLAVVTSMAAGSWLGRIVRSGRPLLEPRVEPARGLLRPAGMLRASAADARTDRLGSAESRAS